MKRTEKKAVIEAMKQGLDLNALMGSMTWTKADYEYHATPSPQFWETWHAHKDWLKAFGFTVTKQGYQWLVIVADSTIIQMIQGE